MWTISSEIDGTGKKALTRAFNTDEALLAGKSMEDVSAFLIKHIIHLLDHNPGHLMSILYRIDVREADVKSAFATTPPAELPAQLAALIISRQLEKLQYRTS